MVSRQDSSTRTTKEAEVCDIIFALKKMDSDEFEPPLFVARVLSRIPNCGPEELDLLSIVDQLNEMERKFLSLESRTAKHSDSIETLLDL